MLQIMCKLKLILKLLTLTLSNASLLVETYIDLYNKFVVHFIKIHFYMGASVTVKCIILIGAYTAT